MTCIVIGQDMYGSSHLYNYIHTYIPLLVSTVTFCVWLILFVTVS